MSIRVRGPWMWAWGLNILAVWAVAFYGWFLDPETRVLLGLAWLSWFVPQEALGLWCNHKNPTPELARTFSQVMQYFAATDKGHSFLDTVTGMDAFVTATVFVASYVVGFCLTATWGLPMGVPVGALMFGWLYGHWHNRGKHG